MHMYNATHKLPNFVVYNDITLDYRNVNNERKRKKKLQKKTRTITNKRNIWFLFTLVSVIWNYLQCVTLTTISG